MGAEARLTVTGDKLVGMVLLGVVFNGPGVVVVIVELLYFRLSKGRT